MAEWGICPFLREQIVIERRDFMKQFVMALLLAGTLLPASYAADTSEQMPPPKIKVGDMAPDFTLEDQNGKQVSLHEFRGKKNVALAFYIFAFTGG
jgi:cytochrome oxidase Cu insertion factor (SCO1/SenC/PrrC family)